MNVERQPIQLIESIDLISFSLRFVKCEPNCKKMVKKVKFISNLSIPELGLD